MSHARLIDEGEEEGGRVRVLSRRNMLSSNDLAIRSKSRTADRLGLVRKGENEGNGDFFSVRNMIRRWCVSGG